LEIKIPEAIRVYPDRPFHPHVTLAHKDVTRVQFEAMWSYYSIRNYHAECLADHFCILSHTSAGWEIAKKQRIGKV
jgi:2'-5' RNA ligase